MFEIISVIILVYNTAAYLEKCLDSVCGQTYQNLEMICVDDGSEKIVEDYAGKDSWIKVIHKTTVGRAVQEISDWRAPQANIPIKNKFPVLKEVFGRKELFQYVYIRDYYRGGNILDLV